MVHAIWSRVVKACAYQVLMSAAPSRVNRDSRTSELEDDLVVRTPPEASGKVGSVADKLKTLPGTRDLQEAGAEVSPGHLASQNCGWGVHSDSDGRIKLSAHLSPEEGRRQEFPQGKKGPFFLLIKGG
ncbi:hypothetical protein Y1Q_0013046 [Alligator mississippiensis]|uniref:Uncharacterized protein n=1 Tax=Alligator mississippiensis TaxID=8496 RepID=A0A151N7N9_ALLMI|nr:hypothetical protein Y1Q_0013046 [Alligator mississippiensis]